MIGHDAQVPSASGNGQVRIGNNTIVYAGIEVAWTITSDRRFKHSIRPSDLGLDFVQSLNPVSYIRNNDAAGRVEYGLIAQELEKALEQAGVSNSGMITKDEKGFYSVRYNDLLPVLVKAIQEQQDDIRRMQQEKTELEIKTEAMLKRLEKLEKERQ
jgi:hypothetical protein